MPALVICTLAVHSLKKTAILSSINMQRLSIVTLAMPSLTTRYRQLSLVDRPFLLVAISPPLQMERRQ